MSVHAPTQQQQQQQQQQHINIQNSLDADILISREQSSLTPDMCQQRGLTSDAAAAIIDWEIISKCRSRSPYYDRFSPIFVGVNMVRKLCPREHLCCLLTFQQFHIVFVITSSAIGQFRQASTVFVGREITRENRIWTQSHDNSVSDLLPRCRDHPSIR